MESYVCKKCGSVDVFLKSNGTQTGLYCRDCDTWLKWVGKKEIPLVEKWIEDNKLKEVNQENDLSLANETDKRLIDMCKDIVDYMRDNYNPYVKVIISGENIKITEDLINVPIK